MLFTAGEVLNLARKSNVDLNNSGKKCGMLV